MKTSVVAMLLLLGCTHIVCGNEIWNGEWITAKENQSESNTWMCFRKDFELEDSVRTAIAKIAVDSKYWLWINGK